MTNPEQQEYEYWQQQHELEPEAPDHSIIDQMTAGIDSRIAEVFDDMEQAFSGSLD